MEYQLDVLGFRFVLELEVDGALVADVLVTEGVHDDLDVIGAVRRHGEGEGEGCRFVSLHHGQWGTGINVQAVVIQQVEHQVVNGIARHIHHQVHLDQVPSLHGVGRGVGCSKGDLGRSGLRIGDGGVVHLAGIELCVTPSFALPEEMHLVGGGHYMGGAQVVSGMVSYLGGLTPG